MNYQSEVLDRRTGELLRVNIGEWVTFTELGQAYDLGARKVRQIMRHLQWVYAPVSSSRSAYRFTPESLEAGLGKHITKSRSGRPFDVVSPFGQEQFLRYLPSALEALGRRETSNIVEARDALVVFKENRLDRSHWTTPIEVSWLAYARPNLSQDDIAQALSISKQLVSSHLRKQAAMRANSVAR
tara:strand:+ start:3329 stop:3883 length:555 start_codon:yes stop_codon:yes gene_type:complete